MTRNKRKLELKIITGLNFSIFPPFFPSTVDNFCFIFSFLFRVLNGEEMPVHGKIIGWLMLGLLCCCCCVFHMRKHSHWVRNLFSNNFLEKEGKNIEKFHSSFLISTSGSILLESQVLSLFFTHSIPLFAQN